MSFYISQILTVSDEKTENVSGIWDMPNYFLISWVPKTGKNENPETSKKVRTDQSFFLIKLHVTERLESQNEVCEGVAGMKNHAKKGC